MVHGRAFTPRRTKNWERAVRYSARRFADEPMTGPLCVTLMFYRQDHRRCDVDNLSKAILDALNGVAYEDDAQIVQLHLWRLVDNENPRVQVRIEEIPCTAG